MKKFLSVCITLIIIMTVIQYKNQIIEYFLLNFVYKNEFVYNNQNEYKKNTPNMYFNETENYLPQNKKEILNIIYSSLNKGLDEFNFFCENKYDKCIEDVKELTADYEKLSNINNFVHPFNSYDRLDVSINSLGKINIFVNKLYNNTMINIINEKVDDIYNSLINNNMSDYDKIKVIHDYIIDTTKYDKEKANDIINDTNNSKYLSHTAYGPLIEGYGICSGYTDAMAIFLDKMNIQNYKISSDEHVWNLVYIDGKWLHLDLTWDDPVIDNGTEVIEHNYFLITTDELLNKEKTEHNFDQNIFIEAKNI